jgi:hypothetical protein
MRSSDPHMKATTKVLPLYVFSLFQTYLTRDLMKKHMRRADLEMGIESDRQTDRGANIARF